MPHFDPALDVSGRPDSRCCNYTIERGLLEQHSADNLRGKIFVPASSGVLGWSEQSQT
jgi:hypothetical protein